MWVVYVVYGSIFGTRMTSQCFQKVVFMAVKKQLNVQEGNLRHWRKIKAASFYGGHEPQEHLC